MFRFKVDGTSYSLPQTPYEVTYQQGIRIRELEEIFKGVNYGYKLNVLQMLSGCDRLGEVVEEEINAIYKGLPLFSNTSEVVLSDTILMSGKLYGLIDLNEITTAEYMDIESLLNGTEDFYSISSSLAAIFYRPIKKVKKSLLNRLVNLRIKFIRSKFIKPYSCSEYDLEGYNLKESDSRVDEIERCFSWGDAVACLAYYLSWKQELAKKYFLVFPKSDSKEGEKKNKVLGMSEIWGLYHQLSLMTDRSLKEIDYYKSQPLTKVMYHLGYCVQDNASKSNE